MKALGLTPAQQEVLKALSEKQIFRTPSEIAESIPRYSHNSGTVAKILRILVGKGLAFSRQNGRYYHGGFPRYEYLISGGGLLLASGIEVAQDFDSTEDPIVCCRVYLIYQSYLTETQRFLVIWDTPKNPYPAERLPRRTERPFEDWTGKRSEVEATFEKFKQAPHWRRGWKREWDIKRWP